MALKIDTKSLFIGLLAALVLLLALGAGGNGGKFRLSMAASGNYVVYGKIDTLTGEVETWKYVLHSPEIPRRSKGRD